MKYGIREICDVVLKAKANQKIGNKIFYKDEPVLYFDTLKTSTLEGAATTVYAQGGRGNSRLVAWEGERTVTFTMEDALISPTGFAILSGAGLVEANENNKIKVHKTENAKITEIDKINQVVKVELNGEAWGDYVGNELIGNSMTGFTFQNSKEISIVFEINSENLTKDDYFTYKVLLEGEEQQPFWANIEIISGGQVVTSKILNSLGENKYEVVYKYPINQSDTYPDSQFEYVCNNEILEKFDNVIVTAKDKKVYKADNVYVVLLQNGGVISEPYIPKRIINGNILELDANKDDLSMVSLGEIVKVDYYTEVASGTQQIEITPDKFGGNYYLEAATLFRTQDGIDVPANFIIPNCKIQSNFTFTMASSGDPSTFTFIMDAFPDYLRFDKSKKVLAAIQLINDEKTDGSIVRDRTKSNIKLK